MSYEEKLKWWGWGLEGESYSLPDPRAFWSFLEQILGPLSRAPRIASLGDIPVKDPQLKEADIAELKELLGGGEVSIVREERLLRSLGKPRSLQSPPLPGL